MYDKPYCNGPYIAVRLVNPDEAKRFFKDFVDCIDDDNVGVMADTMVWHTDRGYVYLDMRWLEQLADARNPIMS